MKHHFGDFLDRQGGYWTIVPNAERYQYQIDDVAIAQKGVSILTVTKTDSNWDKLSTLPNLEELTLHDPSLAQIEYLSTLWRLKRLRITHARPATLDSLCRLQGLEELVLEYVSGFSDLTPVGQLKNLRALHLENLRRVKDFSGLVGAENLRYLYIDGTVDWRQPVESFEFLGSLQKLEVFRLGGIRSLADYPAMLPLTTLKHLKNIRIPTNAFPIEEFALIETALPGVEGAKFEPVDTWIRYSPLSKDDIRSNLSDEEIRSHHPDIEIKRNGKREIVDPDLCQYWLIGKGMRAVRFSEKNAQAKCEAHRARYEAAKRDALQYLSQLG